MLVLNLPFKALMFLTLMRPSLVLFLVLWLKLVKDFLKVRCRLALLPFLISCLIWLDLVASLPLIKERILVIILLLHFLSLMLGSVLVLMLPLLVWLTPDLRIKKMTRKVSAEVDLVHQQTQNQRYGSSHIGATAKDISNVVTDAASGVVDMFHGIDKAVADTWNNFWKDGKADGIGSNLSRK